MALTILTGHPATGMTAVVHDAVRDAVRAGRAAALLLPTLPDVRRAQRALAADCPFGLEVGQLDRMIETQWSLHGDGRLFVGRVERQVLLARSLGEVAPGLAGSRGLVDLLAQVARRGAERIDPGGSGGPSPEARALVSAVRRYRVMLSDEGLVEPGEAALLAARDVPPPASLVAVHRFTDLGPAQEAVIAAWARAADVIVSLPYATDMPAGAALTGVVTRLADAGGVIREVPAAPRAVPELAEAGARLFSPGRPLEATGAVVLGVAQGAEAEARLAARHVTAALAQGVPAERIAVAFRDPARHYHWLRRVLEEEGVAADYDVSLAAGETPLGQALLRLWGFAAGGFRRVDLTAFLRSPYSGVAAAIVDSADERWRARRVPDGPGLLESLPGASPGRRIVERAMEWARIPLTRDSAIEWQKMADTVLANGYREGVPTEGGLELLDSAVHRQFVSALQSLCAMHEATPGQAFDALREATVSPLLLERPGCVQVLGVDRLRSRRFDVVVLGGLTAAEFPRRGMGDTLEGDAVRAAMDALGVPHDQEEEMAKERLLFHLAVTRPRTRLVLLRQECDEEGRATRRSVFWDEVLDLYRDESRPDAEPAVAVEEMTVDAIARREARDGLPCRPRRGVIADQAISEELGRERTVSASEIESYLTCPYAWFVERVLKPGRPDVEIDGRLRGAIAHDAIRLFYESLARAGERRITPGNLAAALGLVPAAAAAALERAPRAHTLEEVQALSSVERMLRGLVERDATFLAGYAPAEHEWSFGGGAEMPLLIGGFALKGRADRIDVGPEGLVVIDYKTSSATPQAKFEEEGKVQLQLYALAASRAMRMPVAGGLYRSLAHARDRGFMTAEYAGGGITRTDRLPAEGVAALLERAVERAREAVEGMRAGRIGPTPDAKRCSYCGAASYCGRAAL